MLAGDDTQAKPDRHVLRFLKAVSDETVSVQQADELLTDVVKYLKPVYPHLTVRLLDYTIWNYMAHGGTVQRRLSKKLGLWQSKYGHESESIEDSKNGDVC